MAGSDTWRAALRTYYCIKFSLSFYSTLFSLIGLLILSIGIYAESERRKHQTLEGIFLAPAIILLLLGILMFVVSFIGMVGSLRDNLLLLKILQKFAHANILGGMKHYYDDLDFKNIMDFVQEKFSCCGGDQFTDWKVNPYHSCNSTGPLSCGVPYTCCLTGTVFCGDLLLLWTVPDMDRGGSREHSARLERIHHFLRDIQQLIILIILGTGGVKNTLCGYQTLDKERLDVANIIHVRGCIHAVGLWLNDNFGITFGLVAAVLAPQALGIGLSYLFWTKLKDICSAYDEVDFRFLKLKEFNFKELDLSGAGCCLCLPREEGYLPVNTDSDDEKAS
ncbi:tetraspanin-15-like isoform X2 [Dendropsophus ebraccatus]|uniref:tetraspanin-15-like isoform X2 n=1 Tax=Dendropsophus ebraccatus TaxID=150705 RepID=UPI003831FEAB